MADRTSRNMRTMASVLAGHAMSAMSGDLLAAADKYESLQSQLAAANERADGLQRIVDEARAQKPVAWRWLFSDGVADTDRCFRGEGPPPHIEQEVLRGAIPRTVQKLYATPVPAQPAVVPEGLALSNIAAISHCGGLAKLDNENALSNIRQLSKPWCDNTGTLRDLKNRVDAAILSATEGRKDE